MNLKKLFLEKHKFNLKVDIIILFIVFKFNFFHLIFSQDFENGFDLLHST